MGAMHYATLSEVADVIAGLATLASIVTAGISAYKWGKASGFSKVEVEPIPDEVSGFVVLNGHDLGLEFERLLRLRQRTEAFLDDAELSARKNRSGAKWAMLTALFAGLIFAANYAGRIGQTCSKAGAELTAPCELGRHLGLEV